MATMTQIIAQRDVLAFYRVFRMRLLRYSICVGRFTVWRRI